MSKKNKKLKKLKKLRKLKKRRKDLILLVVFLFVIIAIVFVSTVFVSTFKKNTSSKPPTVCEAPGQSTTTPKQIVRGDISKKEVIFTFDGGSGVQSGDEILAVLAKHHVKGTFFLTGKMIEANPGFVKRIVAARHEIFNHTYDHTDMTTISDAKIGEELIQMEKILRATVGVSPKPYFRVPYGACNAKVLVVASDHGYRAVGWTVDALDWKESEGETADQVKEKILSTLAPGYIYLMHVGDNITGAILDDVFTTIESKGYKIVSLTQGL